MKTSQESYEQTNKVVNASVELLLEQIDKEIDTKIKGGLFELEYTDTSSLNPNVLQSLFIKLRELGYSVIQAENKAWMIGWKPNRNYEYFR